MHEVDVPPGPAREEMVRPLMRQLVEAVRTSKHTQIAVKPLSCSPVARLRIGGLSGDSIARRYVESAISGLGGADVAREDDCA
eukprot:2619881-Amphidinium_carterae.2